MNGEYAHCLHILGTVRDHSQNTTNPAISLVVYNVILFLIGPSARALITSNMYHVGEGTRPCPFPVTGNGHGRVIEPQDDQYSGRDLGIIPNDAQQPNMTLIL